MRSLSIGKLAPLGTLIAAFATVLALACAPARTQDHPGRILYFTHSAGYRHEVIPVSREILKELGEISPRFEVAATEDVGVFTAQNLRRYGAVMFFTAGELPMNDIQRQALIDFVREGGGFLGVHSATDTFYRWPEYHLGADWLDRLELLILVEDEFSDVEISAGNADHIQTVGDLIRLAGPRD